MERETGFEPATSTLARSHSTTELFPLARTSTVPHGRVSQQAGPAPKTVSRARSDARMPQHLRGFFGRRRIDVKAGPPFEAGGSRQLRNELYVPVIELARVLGKRRAVHDQVVGGAFERPIH